MLELEILESSALSDIGHVRSIMLDCQALGISFALDDFGTGYSSMSYLKRLPADVLKIDQSFVRNMLVDRDDLHLVSAVIGLARSFGLGVIAEGVETIEHGAMLMRLGCDLAQGYGIARPMPADEVLSWVASFDAAPIWQAATRLPPILSLHGEPADGTSQMPLFVQG
jgi:EAL domain-containing protein (putative c-di-GMP-specific phosphodiesterase class I)